MIEVDKVETDDFPFDFLDKKWNHLLFTSYVEAEKKYNNVCDYYIYPDILHVYKDVRSYNNGIFDDLKCYRILFYPQRFLWWGGEKSGKQYFSILINFESLEFVRISIGRD